MEGFTESRRLSLYPSLAELQSAGSFTQKIHNRWAIPLLLFPYWKKIGIFFGVQPVISKILYVCIAATVLYPPPLSVTKQNSIWVYLSPLVTGWLLGLCQKFVELTTSANFNGLHWNLHRQDQRPVWRCVWNIFRMAQTRVCRIIGHTWALRYWSSSVIILA